MSKQSIKTEIQEFKSNGGKFQFTFGDVHLPVVYHETLGVMSVSVNGSDIFVPVDYQMNLYDNMAVLIDKLLDKYPQLSD